MSDKAESDVLLDEDGGEPPHILVVDDDDRIRKLVQRYLTQNGFRVTVAGDAAQARARMQGLDFDLLVLDVMMPGLSGVDFARLLRKESRIPILMLTARAEVGDRLDGLESGVDDYLTKPFEPRELVLRIKSILRRAQTLAKKAEIRMGQCRFNRERGELTRNGKPVRLTTSELTLLKLLAQTPGKPISRLELTELTGAGLERSIDVQVNRLRRKIEADPKMPVYLQTVRGVGYALNSGLTMAEISERPAVEPPLGLGARARHAINYPFAQLKPYLPRGLFPRSLLIIVMPVVLLQIIVTIIFFERHYQLVTRRLSTGVAGDIAMVLSLYKADPFPQTIATLHDSVFSTMQLDISFLPDADLPRTEPFGPFDVLDKIIDDQLSAQISQPYWFNAYSDESFVDIRVALDGGVLQVLVRRSQVLATNWHIFLVWMVLSSILILAVAVGFLRNQVRTITRLAHAAEAFGRGRDVPDFRPSGALEVRAAARALIDMRNRLSRYVEQRTDMLAGISHDMRTPLTRIRLQLALLEPSSDIDAMRGDLDEMEHMLDEYLAFARGEGSEHVAPADIAALIDEIAANAGREGHTIETIIEHSAREALRAIPIRRGALRRSITNLLDNARTYGKRVRLTLRSAQRYFEISVEDDGPGIPAEQYEEAFKPFRRLDTGLQSHKPGSGLGLAISRDLARSHGGEIHLSKSALGGLKAAIRLPI